MCRSRAFFVLLGLGLLVACEKSEDSMHGKSTTPRGAGTPHATERDVAVGKDAIEAQSHLNLNLNLNSELGEELVTVITAGHPNCTEEVMRLLQSGAPVDYGTGTGTPLNLAAYNNDLPIVRLLVAAGAKINIAHRAPQEMSTLELAIRSPYGEPLALVQFLVASGAAVDTETEGAEADPGSSPQLAAIRRCNPRVLSFLHDQTEKRVTVSPDEVCRDRRPPDCAESDRIAIERLIATP